MDIFKIGVSQGEQTPFMNEVHPSLKKRCQRYVIKSDGPYKVFRAKDNQTPITQLEEAFKELEQYKHDIGVVIDSSTTRGFLVPSAASLYSQQLKLKPLQCFDIGQACNGYAVALQQAYMQFQCDNSLKDKYILIINNEFPPKSRALLPEDVNDYKSVASYFVGLTFSTVCTCTLLKKSSNYSWQFYNHDNTMYASHISIGLPKIAKGYLPQCNEYDVDFNEQYGQFCIPRLHQIKDKVLFIFQVAHKNSRFFKKAHIITHTFTKSVYEKFFYYENIQKLSLYYDNTGNLGSCSMPFIIWNEYKNQIPDQQNISFIGNAAGGHDIIVNFTHNHQEKGNENSKQVNRKKHNMSYGNLTFAFLAAQFATLVAIKKFLFCKKRSYKVSSYNEPATPAKN